MTVADRVAPPEPVVPQLPAKGREARKRIASRPAGVRLIETDDEIVVRIPWRIQATPIVHMFFLLIGLVVVGAVLNGESLLGEGLFAIAFLVVYLYLLVNATEVRIRTDGVAIRHGPLWSPMDPNVRVQGPRLGVLDVRAEEMVVRGRYGRTSRVTHYSLYASGTLLLRKFATEALVDYVAQLIQATVETPIEIRYSGP